jgi:hypothetical protein
MRDVLLPSDWACLMIIISLGLPMTSHHRHTETKCTVGAVLRAIGWETANWDKASLYQDTRQGK